MVHLKCIYIYIDIYMDIYVDIYKYIYIYIHIYEVHFLITCYDHNNQAPSQSSKKSFPTKPALSFHTVRDPLVLTGKTNILVSISARDTIVHYISRSFMSFYSCLLGGVYVLYVRI
jgi:hypothetical protein